MTSSLSYFVDAIGAYHSQAYADALRLTEQAATADPHSLFFQQAVLFLRETAVSQSSAVYASPEGFEQFIRGGGNLPLYVNTSAQLKQLYAQYQPQTLLDIGVGDGHALLPALDTEEIMLDLVEPSAAMLNTLTQQLTQRSVPFRAHPMRWQQFKEQTAVNVQTWELIQMTFSAHTFHPAERAALLAWCAEHSQRFVMVEFDVPLFAEMLTPEVISYYVAKYELGLAEYVDQPVVMQGFLMPVFFGNFAHDSERLTFEQTAVSWQADLEQAGFTAVQKHPIFEYWWASAFMLEAKGQG